MMMMLMTIIVIVQCTHKFILMILIKIGKLFYHLCDELHRYQWPLRMYSNMSFVYIFFFFVDIMWTCLLCVCVLWTARSFAPCATPKGNVHMACDT